MVAGRASQRSIFSEYLEEKREELRLGLAAVAARCGKSVGWYERIEYGARKTLSGPEKKLLAKALCLPQGELERKADEAGF